MYRFIWECIVRFQEFGLSLSPTDNQGPLVKVVSVTLPKAARE